MTAKPLPCRLCATCQPAIIDRFELVDDDGQPEIDAVLDCGHRIRCVTAKARG